MVLQASKTATEAFKWTWQGGGGTVEEQAEEGERRGHGEELQ